MKHARVFTVAWVLGLLYGQIEATAQTAPESPAATEKLRSVIADVTSSELAHFHANCAQRLEELRLDDVLKRKNPYLFRAKNIATSAAFVDTILDAHVSSQEEGVFGGVLERIALAVNAAAFGGRKSGIEGIDLEFEKEATKYLVSIKSGPNWGNSSQIRKMEDDFQKARRTLGTNTNAGSGKVVAVNGCCYGATAAEDKGNYIKVCGAGFWQLISGSPDCYQWVMEALDDQQTKAESGFRDALDAKRTELATEFTKRFCDEQGSIRWSLLLEFNSGPGNK
ncbi:MAG: PmeII family type II restriction endonuclease [Verrucomicrobia bacterium]|nr:PmeII family type II restriction endonuclease [Verrucomicrobiota bacterium]